MEGKGRTSWHGGTCPTGHAVSALLESAVSAPLLKQLLNEPASAHGIAFGSDPQSHAHPEGRIPIPGYTSPALPLKPVRDPSLSLIALSGVDPSGPVMVEVPLVQNNNVLAVSQALAGRRIGFAERFVQGEPLEHTTAFLNALDVLRRAGAQLVPVLAQRSDDSLLFDLQTRNEIDAHVSENRLDALVSDSRSAAFHAACWNGYPVHGEPLEEGATVWFYGARWSKDALQALVQEYRSAQGLMPAPVQLQ